MKRYVLPSLILSVILIISAVLMPAIVQAADGNYSITMNFVTKEDGAIFGSEFKLYLALDYEENLTKDFAGYNGNIGNLEDAGDVSELIEALASYVSDNNIHELSAKKTNAAGVVTFSGLESGIYLVVGSSVTIDNKVTYTPKSSLIRVPYRSESGLVTDAVAIVKYGREIVPVSPSPSSSPEPSATPEPTEAPEPSATPEPTEAPEPSESPDPSVTPEPTATPEPSETPEPTATPTIVPSVGTGTGSGTSEKLPQTGQLWWPVPLLFIMGLGFFLTGIVTKNLND